MSANSDPKEGLMFMLKDLNKPENQAIKAIIESRFDHNCDNDEMNTLEEIDQEKLLISICKAKRFLYWAEMLAFLIFLPRYANKRRLQQQKIRAFFKGNISSAEMWQYLNL